ncbi:MAG: succinyldiaminopimelate transaminase, partial [Planctomycetes bacterium]|nr:succinyldiaminopimelate transaminase [Planctomycetota bacterium]
MNPTIMSMQPYPMAELQRRKQSILDQGKTLYDFGTGDPIEATPDFIRQAMADGINVISQYPTVAGEASLRQSIHAYIQRRFSCDLDPHTSIIPTAGSKESIFHLPLAFLDAQSEKNAVIYGTPA